MSTLPFVLPNPPYYPGEVQVTPFLGLSILGLSGAIGQNMVILDTFAANTVTSAFGRTGVISAQTNDYGFSNLSGELSLSQIPTGGDDTTFLRGDQSWSIPSVAAADLSGNFLVDQTIAFDGPVVGTADSGISRIGADSLAVGNGNQGDTSGTWTAAKFVESQTLSPTSAGTAGTTGQLAWDGSKFYVCTAGGIAGAATWKAVAISAV